MIWPLMTPKALHDAATFTDWVSMMVTSKPGNFVWWVLQLSLEYGSTAFMMSLMTPSTCRELMSGQKVG